MNRWDVYWAAVPFEEDPSQIKVRPVVIARDQSVYVLTLRVTSHEARYYDPYDYTLLYWQHAGLANESVVRVCKLAQLPPENIQSYIGRLHPVDVAEIQKLMKQYLSERSS